MRSRIDSRAGMVSSARDRSSIWVKRAPGTAAGSDARSTVVGSDAGAWEGKRSMIERRDSLSILLLSGTPDRRQIHCVQLCLQSVARLVDNGDYEHNRTKSPRSYGPGPTPTGAGPTRAIVAAHPPPAGQFPRQPPWLVVAVAVFDSVRGDAVCRSHRQR
ncbi:hypothetical protein WCLP8_420025 [uncultured Gammaproteobacteria bacterium]